MISPKRVRQSLISLSLLICVLNSPLLISQTFTKVTSGPIANNGYYTNSCGWGDYNNDGLLDLFFARGSSQNNLLFKNEGTLNFTQINVGNIVNDGSRSRGLSWGDLNNDGFLDIFIANYYNNALYINNGDDSFTQVLEGEIVNDNSNSEGCCLGDYNNDGYLDVFVANRGFNLLFKNNKDGTFEKILTGSIVNEYSESVSCSWADYDKDSFLDLFVANTQGENNYLYRNNGDETFDKITIGNIVNDGGYSSGCSWGDYNNDGYLDLFVANFGQYNFLYRNNGDGSFTKITSGIIVNDLSDARGGSWGDYNNDMLLDLFVANGSGQNNFLYQNIGGGLFSKILTGIVVSDGGNSTTGISGDYDNDGDLDLIVSNWDENTYFYTNDGNSNNWINIQCLGTSFTNVSSIGVKILLKADSLWQFKEIVSQTGSRGSQNSLNIEFGLGNAMLVDSLIVVWPASDTTQIFTNVAVNQFLTISEPTIPFILSVAPINGYQGLILNLMITGKNTRFQDSSGTSGVWLEKDSSVISATSFNVLSNTSLEAEFYIPASADTGLWDLAVETELDSVLTLKDAVTIYPEPAVAVIGPGFTNPLPVQINDSITVNISIANAGGDTLVWSARASRSPVSPLKQRSPRVRTKTKSATVEESPSLSESLVTVFPAPWDLQFGYSLPSVGNAGVEFDGEYFYITKWASVYIDKYDLNGNFIEEFTIPGVIGLRDLAFDGTYMYGSNAGAYFYIMDFTTQTLVGAISSPVAVRHIAYDEENDGFWVGNWNTDIVLVDRNGTVMNSIPAFTHGLGSMYGSAYDGWSDGGPYLWVFDQGGGFGFPQYIHQIDLTSGTPTGFGYDVSADFPASFGIAGGLFTTEGIEPGKVTIGGVLQGTPDVLFGYELTEEKVSWLKLLEDGGVISPGDQFELPMRVFGTEGDGDTAYVVIRTNDPMVPVVNVEIIRDVLSEIEDTSRIPATFEVFQNYPNPFNPSTTIKFQLPRTQQVKIEVIDILGQKVRTLLNRKMKEGYHEVVWDGRNDLGNPVASGNYIFKFKAGDFKEIKKMILFK